MKMQIIPIVIYAQQRLRGNALPTEELLENKWCFEFRENHTKSSRSVIIMLVYIYCHFFFWVYEIEGKAYSNAKEWKSPCLFKVAVQVDMNTHTKAIT